MMPLPLRLRRTTRGPVASLTAAALAAAWGALAPAASAALVFAAERQTFKAAVGQATQEAVFTFVNEGTETVRITNVTTSCGCTVPTLDEREFAPGAQGSLKAVLTIGDRVGPYGSTVTVFTSAPAPHDRIVLGMEVDIPRVVEIEPRVVSWNVASPLETKTLRMKIHPEAGFVPTGVASTQPNVPAAFTTELVPGEAAGEYEIRITPLDTGARHRSTFMVTTDKPAERLSYLTVFAFVK